MIEGQGPWVGDEVLEATGARHRRGIVTDVRDGVLWLRGSGPKEWPVRDVARLTVIRTRAQRVAAGET